MKGQIFLFSKDQNRLIPMQEVPYPQEEVLQNWLSGYPELLPGDQIDPENPRRWLLVKAEMGVPDREGGYDRWSLDHLFLDQDGIPTFVECKRSSDTRARREVVAQMLDYAANGTEYWSIDRIRQSAAETSQEKSLDERVAALIESQDEDAIEGYWQTVETNLNEGKVRLLFVADETTRELRRLVEFLNEKLTDVEVLAVEVKQFTGEAQTAVVPRVIGATEASRGSKTVHRRSSPWTEEEFKAKIAASSHRQDLPVVEKVLAWAKDQGFRTRGGRGAVMAGLDLVMDTEGGVVSPFSCYDSTRSTKFHVFFSQIEPIAGDPEAREDLLSRLEDLGFSISSDPQYPGIRCEQLLDSAQYEEFIKTLEWIIGRIVPR